MTLVPLTPDEARALPIFPLPDAVLLPGSTMALHLFEPRYRTLARACLMEGPAAMAIALLLPGFEADYLGRPPIARIAGVGRIVAHHARPAGTFDLLLMGTERVSLDEILDAGKEFRVAQATRIQDPQDSSEVARSLEALSRLAARLTPPPRMMPLPPPEIAGPQGRRMDLLTDRHFPTNEGGTRRAVLEAVDLSDRARVLHDALSLRLLREVKSSGPAN